MLVVTIAHHREAKPLIELFKLEQLRSVTAFPLFQNDQIRLVISGIGAMNSAIATTLAFSTPAEDQLLGALNFGICGARASIELGTIAHVDAISESTQQKTFHPDMVLDLKLKNFSLETRHIPYTHGATDPLKADLVDMEAAGFYEAARAFVPPSAIFVLKVVSDHGASFEEIRSNLPRVLDAQAAQIKDIIERVAQWLDARRPISHSEQALIDAASERLRLTESQRQKLLFLCRARQGRGDTQLIVEKFKSTPQTSEERRQTFKEISNALALSIV